MSRVDESRAEQQRLKEVIEKDAAQKERQAQQTGTQEQRKAAFQQALNRGHAKVTQHGDEKTGAEKQAAAQHAHAKNATRGEQAAARRGLMGGINREALEAKLASVERAESSIVEQAESFEHGEQKILSTDEDLRTEREEVLADGLENLEGEQRLDTEGDIAADGRVDADGRNSQGGQSSSDSQTDGDSISGVQSGDGAARVEKTETIRKLVEKLVSAVRTSVDELGNALFELDLDPTILNGARIRIEVRSGERIKLGFQGLDEQDKRLLKASHNDMARRLRRAGLELEDLSV